MRFGFDALADLFKVGLSTSRETDAPVRVAVYVDDTATPFLIDSVREAFVPRTTSALVRVARLDAVPVTPKPDTDVVLVLTCGSDHLQEAVQQLVIAGAPVCVIAESSVEAPFIEADTPLLGLIAATERTHLLDDLARWILDRTEKDAAFSANFDFMRAAASMRAITSCAITNMATGALFIIPGADFPVMTAAQIGMALKLASIYGYGMKPERGYEIAAVVVAGLGLRGVSRAITRHTPHVGFIVKALVAGFGTYGMGCALAGVYRHGVDYARANEVLAQVVDRVKRAAAAPPAQDTRSSDAVAVEHE